AAAAPKGKAKDKDLDKTSEKMIRAGLLAGRVVSINESKKSLRLAVSVPYVKTNAGAAQALAQAHVNYLQALSKRDPSGARSAQVEMVRQQANLYTVEHVSQEVELSTIDDVVVRLAQPRLERDEKGRVKLPTRAQLKEMKGDPKLPGYKAEFSDLAQEQ